MSYAGAIAGVHERLATVQGLKYTIDGPPTAVHDSPMAYTTFRSMTRNQTGQQIANHYLVDINLLIATQETIWAESEIRPFINSIPAAFDPKTLDAAGHQTATLGGRVNVSRVTEAQAGYVQVGGTNGVEWRYVTFILEIVDKGPTGSGI